MAANVPMSSPQGDPPRTGWLLAIDSSTEQTGIGLAAGSYVSELIWPAGRTQTVTLLAEIDHLLTLAGIEANDLSALAVATGPGTFSGLRIGMSIAKGLVLALDLPLIGIPTLAITAWPLAPLCKPVVAVAAAGRSRLVWAHFGPTAAGWAQTIPPRNGTAAELIAELRDGDDEKLVIGELTPEQANLLGEIANVTLFAGPGWARRPAALAALARRRLQQGDIDDPVTLEPIYLHGTRRPATGS